MKSIHISLGAAVVSLLVGCSTGPVALAPVGPNPNGGEDLAANGQLQVFSALVGRSEGDNPTWVQHSSYEVYTLRGKPVEHVDNTVGRYAEAPRQVSLPAGEYLVKARAKDAFWVRVPVLIERGRTTRIHLDDRWNIPANTPRSEFVWMPAGVPVGWRTSSTNLLSAD